MQNVRRQKGMTGIGWIIVFLLIAFFTLVGVKVLPIYISSMTVSSVLSDMEQEYGMGSKTPGEIIRTFSKRMQVNNISDVTHENVYIERSGNVMLVEVDYEVRRNFIGNMDIVVKFSKTAEIPRN